MVQRDLDIVRQRSEAWQIDFNIDKYKVMHFVDTDIKQIHEIFGEPLPEANEIDLEMIISYDLNCKDNSQLHVTKQTVLVFTARNINDKEQDKNYSLQRACHITLNYAPQI